MNAPLHPLLTGIHLECRSGWFNIIRVLCEQLQGQTDRFGAPEPKVQQVKEKYGTLHFYANHCSLTQDALIEFAEELSAHTCEVCGKSATLRKLGWMQTLCDEHADRGRNMIAKRRLDSIPQWDHVCWYMVGEALLADHVIHALYRRNWTYIDEKKLSEEDWSFIKGLGEKYGEYGEFSPLPDWTSMTIQERQQETHKRETMQELVDLVELWISNNPGGTVPDDFDAEDWIAQWVHQKHPRLSNDRPSDYFFSQDGMGEVEALLREEVRIMLYGSNRR